MEESAHVLLLRLFRDLPDPRPSVSEYLRQYLASN